MDRTPCCGSRIRVYPGDKGMGEKLNKKTEKGTPP